jgi:hypothetical protein
VRARRYLYDRFNMTNTSWSPTAVPSIAGGIRTTGADFQNLLHGLLTYNGISQATVQQMETDWTQEPIRPSGDGWFGCVCAFARACVRVVTRAPPRCRPLRPLPTPPSVACIPQSWVRLVLVCMCVCVCVCAIACACVCL